MSSDSLTSLSALKFTCGESTHVCRLCLASTENGEVSLEDPVRVQRSYFDQDINFLDMFDELGVHPEPLLPQALCLDCATTVINAFLFQKLCQYSNEKWMDSLQQLQICLSQSEMINPNMKTAYIMVNQSEKVIFTSRKSITQCKTSAVKKIKNIMNSKLNYAQKKKSKNFVCSDCGAQYKSKTLYSKHLKTHNKETEGNSKRIPCPQCFKHFATKMQMEDHAERVHYPKNIQCSQCAKMFSTERMLKRHEKFHHIATICKLCFVQFPSKNHLRAHLDKHDMNKCEQCNKTFLNKHTFKRHLVICGNPDSKNPIFFCDICNKGYARKNSLRTHLKTDHGFGRVYPCSWCNKKFDAISRLRNHIVKHTKEKNFSCEDCGGRFVTQAALVYHTRLHTGEKPFPCDMCDESFLSASRRMEHKRRKHFEPSKECPVCHVKFVTGHQLKKHVQRHYNPQSKLFVHSQDAQIYDNNENYNILA